MLGHDQLMIAQMSDPPTLVNFLQYGALGLMVIGLLIGWVWPKPSVDRLLRDISRLETQVDELTRVYQAEVIPTLTLVLKRLEKRLVNEQEP